VLVAKDHACLPVHALVYVGWSSAAIEPQPRALLACLAAAKLVACPATLQADGTKHTIQAYIAVPQDMYRVMLCISQLACWQSASTGLARRVLEATLHCSLSGLAAPIALVDHLHVKHGPHMDMNCRARKEGGLHACCCAAPRWLPSSLHCARCTSNRRPHAL
jgi:hypothetical protein